ncbi:hypothetical protein TNCV_348691 [Trichonephila clavipes]|nr:hypothetical protein TNCV_348691 [Trichonephila clavipes]
MKAGCNSLMSGLVAIIHFYGKIFLEMGNSTISSLMSCSNLDSNEDIRMSESDCEESKESVDVIDNIPVRHDIARVDTEWISHNSNVPGRFVTRNV